MALPSSLEFRGNVKAIVWRRTVSVKCRRAQANALRSLAIEAYQPKLFEEDLTAKEAATRIEALRREIEFADSF